MYYLKNESGDYLFQVKGGECLTTADIARATRFYTFEEASEFRRTLPKSKFQIKNIEEEDTNFRKGHVSESLKDMEDIHSIMNSLRNRVTGVIDEEEYCNRRLNEIKLELVDISHSIELYNMSASEGYKKAKLLQDTLRERRQLKDRLLEIEILKNFNPNNYVMKRFDGLADRKYCPRRMPELFK